MQTSILYNFRLRVLTLLVRHSQINEKLSLAPINSLFVFFLVPATGVESLRAYLYPGYELDYSAQLYRPVQVITFGAANHSPLGSLS